MPGDDELVFDFGFFFLFFFGFAGFGFGGHEVLDFFILRIKCNTTSVGSKEVLRVGWVEGWRNSGLDLRDSTPKLNIPGRSRVVGFRFGIDRKKPSLTSLNPT
jgi:hypothetical protein